MCISERCKNHTQFCFIDQDGSHYAIMESQHEAWANVIIQGEAVVAQSLLKLYDFWKYSQGNVDVKYKYPIQH